MSDRIADFVRRMQVRPTDRVLELGCGSGVNLLAMEQHYCRQEPFVSLGRYIHVMAQKPAG